MNSELALHPAFAWYATSAEVATADLGVDLPVREQQQNPRPVRTGWAAINQLVRSAKKHGADILANLFLPAKAIRTTQISAGHTTDASTHVNLEKAEKEKKHLQFLGRIAKNEDVPAGLAARAELVWRTVRAASRTLISVPIGIAHVGGPVTYTWRTADHEVEIEIPATGPCSWFCIDRKTHAATGGEQPAEEIAIDADSTLR